MKVLLTTCSYQDTPAHTTNSWNPRAGKSLANAARSPNNACSNSPATSTPSSAATTPSPAPCSKIATPPQGHLEIRHRPRQDRRARHQRIRNPRALHPGCQPHDCRRAHLRPAHRPHKAHRHHRRRRPQRRMASPHGHEIYEKTMGIIGLGRIGKEVAVRARAFDMKVIAFDPYWTANSQPNTTSRAAPPWTKCSPRQMSFRCTAT